MLLVTGATGNIGRVLVRQLAATGESVRALSRGADASAAPPGVDVVAGDLNDPASLAPAFEGVRGVFLMPGYDHKDETLAAMKAAGVEHVVMLSGGSAGSGDTTNAVTRYMVESEEAVRASGLPWTFIRPYAFMSNALRWRDQLLAGDTVAEPFADVPSAVIDPADIAAVAAAALTEPGHEGEIYTVSGPQPLLPAERLAILGAVLGRDLTLRPLSDDEARAKLTAEMPEAYVDAFFDFYVDGSLNEESPRRDVKHVLGRAPGSFREWAVAHAAEFA